MKAGEREKTIEKKTKKSITLEKNQNCKKQKRQSKTALRVFFLSDLIRIAGSIRKTAQ